jgi:hypothetical protein
MKPKSIHFDCFAGISGDMVLGALFSLGVSPSEIEAGIKALGIEEFSIGAETVDRSGISSVKALVVAPDAKNHRHLPDIEKMIDGSDLSPWVRQKSKEIFRNLARAEAKVHGIPLEKVHFHEVGALDSIIDIVGSCMGFEILGVTKFSSSKLHVGSGFVDMAHGKFPVPPPAVSELLRDIPFYSTEIEGELVTPTGAAIVATLCSEFGSSSVMRSESIGYGAGGRVYKGFPNTLRLVLGEFDSGSPVDEKLTLLETNIDDMDAEAMSFAMEAILSAGALDCWFTPIQMKKGRPATMLSVLCGNSDSELIGSLLLNMTTSIGYRKTSIERICLQREEVEVSTELGTVKVKIVERPDSTKTFKVEHESMRTLAAESGKSLLEVRAIINQAVENKVGKCGI